MDELRTYVRKKVLPRLDARNSLEHVVRIAKDVVKLILKQLGHTSFLISDEVTQDCSLLVKDIESSLADWICDAVQNGISSVQTYLRNHPEVLRKLEAPVGSLVARLTIRTVTWAATKTGVKATASGLLLWIGAIFNLGGVIADFVQAGFEVCGMPIPGRMIGVIGNILSGALAGAIALEGLDGVILGAIIALGNWLFGELFGWTIRNCVPKKRAHVRSE